MNRDQTFAVTVITRREIAELFNDVLDGEGDGRREFADDDARLTDDLCAAFASRRGAAVADAGEDADLAAYRTTVEFVRLYFSTLR